MTSSGRRRRTARTGVLSLFQPAADGDELDGGWRRWRGRTQDGCARVVLHRCGRVMAHGAQAASSNKSNFFLGKKKQNLGRSTQRDIREKRDCCAVSSAWLKRIAVCDRPDTPVDLWIPTCAALSEDVKKDKCHAPTPHLTPAHQTGRPACLCRKTQGIFNFGYGSV